METRQRGQGAMEYLMTYSWAILVVMFVGIALWQLGVFQFGGVSGTTSTGFPRLKPQLALMKVSSTGDFHGTFTNAAGGTIKVFQTNGSCTQMTVEDTGYILNNRNFRINGTGCNVTGSIGDPYEIEVFIYYNISLGETSVTHTEYGTLRGPLE